MVLSNQKPSTTSINIQKNTTVFDDEKYLEIPDSEVHMPMAIDSYLRQKLKEQTLKDCAEFVKEFALCSQDKYFSVVWKCREEQQKMKDCLVEQTTSDRLAKLKRDWINDAKKKMYLARMQQEQQQQQNQ
eukprot:gene1177-1489_t